MASKAFAPEIYKFYKESPAACAFRNARGEGSAFFLRLLFFSRRAHVGGGQGAGFLHEGPAEGAHVFKAALIADLGQGQVGVPHEHGGLVDADGVNEAPEVHLELLGEEDHFVRLSAPLIPVLSPDKDMVLMYEEQPEKTE